MGSEVTRDEIIQAEPSREALHAWVKVGGRRMCQLLLRVYSVRVLGTKKGYITFIVFFVVQRRS